MSTPDQLTERIYHLLDLGRPESALELAHAQVGQRPDDAELWCCIAMAHIQLGNPESALAAAERSSGLGPGPDPNAAQLLRCLALSQLGRGREAILAAQEVVAAAPHDWRSHILRAGALLDYPNSREVASSAGGRSEPRPWEERASVRLSVREAESAAERAVQLAPDEPDAVLMLARVRQRQHRYREAQHLADRGLELAPTSADLLHWRTAILDDGRRLVEPARGFARAAALDPASGAARDFGRVVKRAVQWGALLSILVWGAVELSLNPADSSSEASRRMVAAAVIEACVLAALAAPLARLLVGLSAEQRTAALRTLRRRPRLLAVLGAFAVAPVPLELAVSDDSAAGPARLCLTAGISVLLAVGLGRLTGRMQGRGSDPGDWAP